MKDRLKSLPAEFTLPVSHAGLEEQAMTTEAQRLAELLETDGWPDAAAMLRRQEEEIQEQCRLNGMGAEREARLLARIAEQQVALMQAREVLENSCIRWTEVDEALATINELLGEQT